MNGFFNRLAQRALGTRQTVRPYIAPKFAHNFAETGSVHLVEEMGSVPKEPNSNSNAAHNDKPPPRATQTEAPQKNQQPTRVPEQQTQGGQHLKVTNSIKGAGLSHIERVKSNLDDKNKIDMPKVRSDDEPQITSRVHSHHPAEPVLASDQSSEKRSPEEERMIDEAPLVPMPVDRNEAPEHSATRFENVGNPGNVSLNPGQQLVQSPAILKPEGQQGSDESQTINISIGRVEVRAVHPQPAPIKPERVKTKSALSLEDYLQQRRNGER